MEEMWKTLRYHNEIYNNYEVSTFGNIRSKTVNKNRSLHLDRSGYVCVSVYCGTNNGKKILKNIKVHVAVASTFIENYDNKPTVNHKDGNKSNNYLENLEWATYAEQTQHYLDILGYRKSFSKAMASKFSKSVFQMTKDGKIIKKWNSMREVERELGFLNVCISACARGEQNSAYGYKWSFAEN